MSKKRRAKQPAQAVVVEEVLAEGSGPHALPEEEGVVAVQVSGEPLEAGEQPESVDVSAPADPIAERVERVMYGKGKKAKKSKKAADDVPDGNEADAASDTAEAAELAAEDVATTGEDMQLAASADDARAVATDDADLPAAATNDDDAPAASTDDAGAHGDNADEVGMQAAADAGGSDEMLADGESLDESDEDDEDDEDGEGAVLPTSAATMDSQQLKNLVEALVFASDKPLTVPRLRQLTRVADLTRLEQALTELAADYENRGLILHQVSGGYQFRTRPQYSIWVQQLIAGRPVRLSRAQLETLAIVAYRQPITRPEIDDIRGVDSTATLKLLLDRTLIRPLGKKEEVGRPTLYGTTKEFLDFFSLGDLRELPTLREYSELSEESRRVMSERLGLDPDATPAPTAALASAPADETAGDDGLGGATVQGTRAENDADVGLDALADDSDAVGDDGLGGATVHSGDGLTGETVQSMGEGLDDATVGGAMDDVFADESGLGGGTINELTSDEHHDDLEAAGDTGERMLVVDASSDEPEELVEAASDALESMGAVDVYDPPVDPSLFEASADESDADPVITDDGGAAGDVDTSSSESE
ncbi:MAG: SMC-Scp complex subunit ScpB [Kofleriaceae bacterium]|nr:SMC-Scp complex subunit ScpB [Kofleriaceae bacterium]